MKLSTRSRYGTRMLLDMAQHYNGGPVQLGDIARRQNISLKYLEQIIRPLKKANYIKSFRGAKGGHILNKSPEEITVGEIVALLEGGDSLTLCSENPDSCDRVDQCITRKDRDCFVGTAIRLRLLRRSSVFGRIRPSQ